MQRLFNQLIGNMRPVKVARIDVIDSELNNFAQDRECPVVVCGRPEYMRTSQLHGTISDAGESDRRAWKCKSPAEIDAVTSRIHSIGKLSFQNVVTATLEEKTETRKAGGIRTWSDLNNDAEVTRLC